ncbi:MAG: hypothetical protein HYT82_01045, partial [Candidatus Harrisonbacteria bacterium]|nr:hypothetical protein [Candidatus Harrisonbacteria bacterium]
LKVFLDDIKNFSEAGFNNFTRFILAIIFIFIVVGLVSRELTIREPEVLIAVTWVMVLFFSYMNWMNINYAGIPEIRGMAAGWLKQYITFILVTLGGGFYIIRNNLR